MNVLVVGSGGREHALGWKIAQSPLAGKLFFAPGNAGTAALGENVPAAADDLNGLARFAEAHDCFTVVGPELPLALGLTDVLRARGLPAFGPSKEAARLESSKSYAKAFMRKYGVPTAAYDVFDDADGALAALRGRAFPIWVKADGLAAGKGALFAADKTAARSIIHALMREKAFGEAGARVVLEEHMSGRELTLLCLTDGETVLPFDSARDYKRALDGDRGLNTGGMGSVSPVPGGYPSGTDAIMQATLRGIQAEGLDYRGLLYIGLMATPDGPKVIEYNARFGDPETQAVLPRLRGDLLAALLAAAERRLSGVSLDFAPETAVCVVLASGGYPEAYQKGYPIAFADIPPDAAVFHAGTARRGGAAVTDGGRVLSVTGLGADADAARAKAYAAAARVSFRDCHYRNDIGS